MFTLPLDTFTMPEISRLPNLSQRTVQAQQQTFAVAYADGSTQLMNHLVLKDTTSHHVNLIATKPSDQQYFHIVHQQFNERADDVIAALVEAHIVEIIDDTSIPDQTVVRARSMAEHHRRKMAEANAEYEAMKAQEPAW